MASDNNTSTASINEINQRLGTAHETGQQLTEKKTTVTSLKHNCLDALNTARNAVDHMAMISHRYNK